MHKMKEFGLEKVSRWCPIRRIRSARQWPLWDATPCKISSQSGTWIKSYALRKPLHHSPLIENHAAPTSCCPQMFPHCNPCNIFWCYTFPLFLRSMNDFIYLKRAQSFYIVLLGMPCCESTFSLLSSTRLSPWEIYFLEQQTYPYFLLVSRPLQ